LYPRRYFAKNIYEGVDSTVLTSMTKSETTIMVPHDVDEDGRIDVILQNCYSEGNSKNCHITALYNNYNFDAYFIKSVFLAQIHRDTDDVEKHNHGASISGPTSRYIVTDVNDKKYIRVGTQNPQ
jgi:hypothetical protein